MQYTISDFSSCFQTLHDRVHNSSEIVCQLHSNINAWRILFIVWLLILVVLVVNSVLDAESKAAPSLTDRSRPVPVTEVSNRMEFKP